MDVTMCHRDATMDVTMCRRDATKDVTMHRRDATMYVTMCMMILTMTYVTHIDAWHTRLINIFLYFSTSLSTKFIQSFGLFAQCLMKIKE